MKARRLLVGVLVVSLLGCSGDDDDDASPSTTERETTSTTQVELEESLRLTDECAGIGALTGDHELTYVKDARIWSGDRCIAEYTGQPWLQWGGGGDRLLAGRHSVLLAGGPSAAVHAGLTALGWSAPTGKAIVVRDTEGGLSKVSMDGEPPVSLESIPLTKGEVLYHPSGTAIAAIESFTTNVVLTSNRGDLPQWLLGTEITDEVADIAFSAAGDLVFVARHDAEWHVHRLVLGEETVSDLLVATEEVHHVTPSAWDDTAVAAARGTCAEPGRLFVSVDGAERDLRGTPVELGRPIDWAPDGALYVIVREGCGDERASTGDLYAVRGGEVELVAEGVNGAAVRAQRPPPPPPPPDIPPVPA